MITNVIYDQSCTHQFFRHLKKDGTWHAHASTKLGSHEKAIKHSDMHQGSWLLRVSAPMINNDLRFICLSIYLIRLFIYLIIHLLLYLFVSYKMYTYIYIYIYIRSKFRSQTSDNIGRWKSRGGKSQRGEEKKWEDQRGEREGKKKMQVPEKVGKSRLTVFFQWFVAPEGQKVTSLKRRARSHVIRWEMKLCTP